MHHSILSELLFWVLVVSVGVFKSDGSNRLLCSNLSGKVSGRQRTPAL